MNDHVKARQMAELHLAKLAVGMEKQRKRDKAFIPVMEDYFKKQAGEFLKLCTDLVAYRNDVERDCGSGEDGPVAAWKMAMAGPMLGSVSRIEALLTMGNKAIADPAGVRLATESYVQAMKGRVLNPRALASKLAKRPRPLPPAGGKAEPPPPPASAADPVDVEAEVVQAADEVLDALGVEEHADALDAIRDLQTENARLEAENARLREALDERDCMLYAPDSGVEIGGVIYAPWARSLV